MPRVILLEHALLLVCSPPSLGGGGAAFGAVDRTRTGGQWIFSLVYEDVPSMGREAGIMEGMEWWHKF